MTSKLRAIVILTGALTLLWIAPRFATGADAATDLKLAPGLSFTDDSSPNFPIRGGNLDDATIPAGRPTVIFFGTAHCWNTAREAERLVELYPKFRDRVQFVVVDLDHASRGQRRLAAEYYRGYIPTLVIIDKSGHLVYDRAGETGAQRGDASKLEGLIDSAFK